MVGWPPHGARPRSRRPAVGSTPRPSPIGSSATPEQVAAILAGGRAVELEDRRQVVRCERRGAASSARRPDRGRVRRRARRSRRSGSPSRSGTQPLVDRPAERRREEASETQPAASSSSIDRLGQRAADAARRASASSTKIVPTQPTGPLTVPTPVPTTWPSTSATIGTQPGCVDANRRNRRRSPQPPPDHDVGRRVDVGRAPSGGSRCSSAIAPIVAGRRLSSGHGRPDPRRRRARRPSRPPRPDRRGARPASRASSTTSSTSTRSWPSSTPTRSPPTAQTIELENILRDDVVDAVARRSRPSSRTPPSARGRLHRRAGDPRRRDAG